MKARAPARMAPTTEFSSSYMERMTILQSRMEAQDLLRGFHSIEAGQADVHQHHVGPVALGELHGVGPVFGLSHHAKFARPRLKDGFDAIAHDLMIIHEKDVERHNGSKQLYPFLLMRPIQFQRGERAG